MFALIDCNNFYASCERVFRPDLHNKPIVILSNNDGCVIARSNESKSLGLLMGEPYFKIKARCIQHKIHVFSSNYVLYGDLSSRVMSVIEDAWTDVERLCCVTPGSVFFHKIQADRRLRGIPNDIILFSAPLAIMASLDMSPK